VTERERERERAKEPERGRERIVIKMIQCDLPDHFDDKTMVDALKSSFLEDSLLWPFNQTEPRTLLILPEKRKNFPMICGLLLRLRLGLGLDLELGLE
jgi:hypothetical protein